MTRSLNGKAAPFTIGFDKAYCEGADLSSNLRRVTNKANKANSADAPKARAADLRR